MKPITNRLSAPALLAALAIGAGGSIASADMFTFTYNDAWGTVASGHLVADDLGGGVMHCSAGDITVSAGPLAGLSMTLLPLGPAVTTSPLGLFNVDNLLYAGSPSVDNWGLLFTDGGANELNIWNDGGGVPYTLYVGTPGSYYYMGDHGGEFVLTAVPAPASAAVLGVGMLASTRRRRA